MKNNKVNYVVVGVFVLAMLGAAIAAISVLSGRTGFVDRVTHPDAARAAGSLSA